MKWWIWFLVGLVVMAVTSMIGWAMYKRERRGNPDSLEKAREVKAARDLERRQTVDRDPVMMSDNGDLKSSDIAS